MSIYVNTRGAQIYAMSRPLARHADDGAGKPLCQAGIPLSYMPSDDPVTCLACREILEKRNNAKRSAVISEKIEHLAAYLRKQ